MQDKMLRLCLGAAAVPAAVLLCWLAPAGAAGLRSVAAAVCFCVGTGVGTWLMVHRGR